MLASIGVAPVTGATNPFTSALVRSSSASTVTLIVNGVGVWPDTPLCTTLMFPVTSALLPTALSSAVMSSASNVALIVLSTLWSVKTAFAAVTIASATFAASFLSAAVTVGVFASIAVSVK